MSIPVPPHDEMALAGMQKLLAHGSSSFKSLHSHRIAGGAAGALSCHVTQLAPVSSLWVRLLEPIMPCSNSVRDTTTKHTAHSLLTSHGSGILQEGEAVAAHTEFADNGIQHAKNMVIKLAKAHTPCELYAVHGHYADAGEVAALMSSTLGVEMVMTAHSLGRNKLEHLLASGELSLRLQHFRPEPVRTLHWPRWQIHGASMLQSSLDRRYPVQLLLCLMGSATDWTAEMA